MDLSNIFNNLQLNNTNNKILQSLNSLPNLNIDENLIKFLDGEVVKGEVVDINALVAKIITTNGQEINGHLQNVGQLNIGDEREFLIKNENGLIKFEILKGDETQIQDNNLKKQLVAQGINANTQDMEIAKNLIKNELPVNKDTFTMLSRAMALLSKDDNVLDKALYLLKNEIPVNKENTKILDNLVNKTINTIDNSNQIEQSINNIKNPDLKQQLLDLFSAPEKQDTKQVQTNNLPNSQINNEVLEVSPKDIDIKNQMENIKKDTLTELSSNTLDIEKNIKVDKELVKDILKFSPKDMDLKELDKYLSKTQEKLEKAIEILKESSPKGVEGESQKLLTQLTSQKDGIDFMRFMKNNVYMQIPLNINENKTNGELLVFKDKKRKKDSKNGVSAIIGLDTVSLGRFETYIQKLDNKVNLQFRLENDEVINLTKKNLTKLQELLENHNLQIDSVAYKTIDQSFTLLSKESEFNKDLESDFMLPNSINVKV